MSKQINISDRLNRKLDNIRQVFGVSYSEAVEMYAKGEHGLRVFTNTRMAEIRDAVQRKYGTDPVINAAVFELMKASAIVIKAIANHEKGEEHNHEIESYIHADFEGAQK